MTDSTASSRYSKSARGSAKRGGQAGQSQIADLVSLQTAVNSASSSVNALWLSFLMFMAYLTMTVGAVTHEALLLEKAIKLPVLSVELPLVGFFWIAPLFFLLFHFYLFLQLVILVRKVRSFDENLKAAVVTDREQEEYRKRLDSFLIVQFLCGAEGERTGITGILLRTVAVITLVILPILLLLQFQLTFLPYHDGWVTWIHRIAILIDIRLAWVFWFAIREGNGEVDFPEFRFEGMKSVARSNIVSLTVSTVKRIWSSLRDSMRYHRLGFIFSIVVVFFSFFVFAFDDEPIAKVVKLPVPQIRDNEITWEFEPIANVILHGPINMVAGRPKTWFSNVLIIPDKKLVKDEAVDKDFPSLSLRGRNLSGAVLRGSDLRSADFTGANLNDAVLDGAQLSRAKFGCVSLLNKRTKASWPHDECTWLQRASLSEARLQAADFGGARMQWAILFHADLAGAQMLGTQLQGAVLTEATLHGAWIEGANLEQAFLNRASLIGAKIINTRLRGVLVDDTKFHLAFIKYLSSSSFDKIPIANYGANPLPDEQVAKLFLYAQVSQGDLMSDSEEVVSKLDVDTLNKLRESTYAKLAAQNKLQFIDFNLASYKKADERSWKEISALVEKENSNRVEETVKEYILELACSPGSAPFITAALIDNERIILDQSMLAPKRALEIIEKLKSSECQGAKDLKPRIRVVLGGLEQRIKYAILFPGR